jgi:hypothetical protein
VVHQNQITAFTSLNRQAHLCSGLSRQRFIDHGKRRNKTLFVPMRYPDEPTTPEQWHVIAWFGIVVLIALGAVGVYFSMGAPPDKPGFGYSTPPSWSRILGPRRSDLCY